MFMRACAKPCSSKSSSPWKTLRMPSLRSATLTAFFPILTRRSSLPLHHRSSLLGPLCPPRQPSQPAVALPAQASQALSIALQPDCWAEHLPPKLTPETVETMRGTFILNYPGVLLDQDTMPSIRLLSIVRHSLKPGQRIRWIPWQLRLSQKQYQEAMEAKATTSQDGSPSSCPQPDSRTEVRCGLCHACRLDALCGLPLSSVTQLSGQSSGFVGGGCAGLPP